MTPTEKRIAICEDVLKQLRYYHLSSVYYEGYNTWNIPNEADAQKHWKDVKNCAVCAIGSCMLSYVKLFDNTTVGELRDLDFYDIVRKLRGIFSESQLNWMEQCFEGCPYNKITNLYYNKYCKDKKDRKSLLKAIMKNIIKNNGIFKPQQEVSVSDSLRQNIPFTYATLY
jgi:hypothetical protein